MQNRKAKQTAPSYQFTYIRRQLYLFRRHHVTITAQAFILIAACAFVLYAILFTNAPPIHDFFHALRHSLGILPCH